MIRIALCDDEQRFCNELEHMIKGYFENKSESGTVNIYQNPELMLHEISQQREDYDLLLLDIQMEQQNGIDTAKRIREMGYEGIIVFITACKEYAVEGYCVAAYRYLLKPVTEKELSQVLDYARKEKEKRQNCVLVRVLKETKRIPINEIYYIEMYGHRMLIHTRTEVLETRISLKEFIKALGTGFCQIHKSYMISLEHVKNYKNDSIQLENGDELPLSRNYNVAFRENMAAHWGNRING